MNARIVELRTQGYSWGRIAEKMGISRAACCQRYARALGVSERQRRKHAEALVEAQRAELDEGKGYLTRFLLAIAPECVPFKELPLLATQIDHMYAGQRAELDALRAEVARLRAEREAR